MSIDPPPEAHPADPPLAPFPTEFAAKIISKDSSCEVRADWAEVPPMSRKTRDQPNLAECNGCGLRINTSNGKDKLRPLNSEWRIVLLCMKCFKLCVRGEVCTYCLCEVSGGEIFKCGDCCCKVHKDCVEKFGDFAPWCYLDWRKSTVCVDCWLPGKVVKLRAVEGLKGRGIRHSNGGKKLMEGGVKDGEKKSQVSAKPQLKARPQLAYKAREKSFGKALVEKVAMGKENNSLGSGVSGELSEKSKKDINDAELAIQLHRVMNSSPRISRNVRPSSCNLFGVRKRRGGSNLSSGRTSTFGQNVGAASGGNASNSKGFDATDERADGILKEGQGSCSNNSMDCDPLSWKELDLPKPELRFTYTRRKYRSNDDGKSDQYMFKYSRKSSRLKPLVNRKYVYLYDRTSYENETSSAVMLLQCSTELRNFPDDCVLALPVSTSGKGSLRTKS